MDRNFNLYDQFSDNFRFNYNAPVPEGRGLVWFSADRYQWVTDKASWESVEAYIDFYQLANKYSMEYIHRLADNYTAVERGIMIYKGYIKKLFNLNYAAFYVNELKYRKFMVGNPYTFNYDYSYWHRDSITIDIINFG